PAPREALAARADLEALGRGDRATLHGDARGADRMDDAAFGRGGARLAGQGHRVPAGHGGARPLRQAVPGVRRARAADRLRRERMQLLRALPDRRAPPPPPRAVAAAPGELPPPARRPTPRVAPVPPREFPT